ncbi:MAG: YbjQ family protein [Planctomycetota bacterium]|nr:YbjQ family protein [Planctomycetota bacterium]
MTTPPLAYAAPQSHLPVTTTFAIEGYRIVQYLGIVRGLIVRSPTIAQGILGGLKSIVGGRIGAYTEMCEQTRQQAYDLLIDHARAVGANAIVGFHYDASEIGGKAVSATEVLCYGTAVVIAPEQA